MALSQQLIQLLSQPPGSIVYHVLTLLALQATLGLSLWQWRRNPDDGFARRLAWSSGGILAVRLIVLISLLILSDPSEALRILPPLERAIDSVTAVLLVWAFAPKIPTMPRLGDVVLLLILLLIGFMYAFYRQDWLIQSDAGTTLNAYAESDQAIVWEMFQLLVLGLGGLLVLVGRQSQWYMRLAVLATLFLAHLANLVAASSFAFTDTEVAYWIRLGNLIAFTLLAILAYRHNLSQLVPDTLSARQTSEQSAYYLRITREVIASLETNQTLQRALDITSELVDSNFIALAVISPENPDYLRIMSTTRTNNDNEDGQDERLRQMWALSLADWPAIQMAMHQKESVELQSEGLGARQLHNLYQELSVESQEPLLVEPLLIEPAPVGVLLISGQSEREWRKEDKIASREIAAFLATAIYNAHLYEVANTDSGGMLHSRIASSQRPVHQEDTEHKANGDDSEALEAEIDALRESLREAEEALALAAAGEAGLSAEWMVKTVSRYSNELEDAQARVDRLETLADEKGHSDAFSLISSQAEELRTPLTSLQSYADLLLGEKMGILGTQQIKLLRRMKTNIEQMTSLVDRIIRLAGSERSSATKNEFVDFQDAVDSAVDAIGAQIRTKRLKLDLDVAHDLPPVPSDEDAIYRIVAHLLYHACQVSAADSHLALSARQETVGINGLNSDSSEFIHLAISDKGGNQSQEIHKLIKEAEREPDNPELGSKVGYVGSSMSKAVSLIATQGGRSWISSESPEGSTVSALLPLSSNGSVGADHS
jgi:signal transduction histidine kinase